MGTLHIQTLSTEHAPLGTSRLSIAGRPFLFATWRREGERPVFGEAAPLSGYGDDDFGRAEAALDRLSAGELLEVARAAAADFRSEDQGLLYSERSPLGVVSAWSSDISSPSARFCAEMLVLGAVAGSCGVPVWRLLASEYVALALRTSAVVDPLSPSWFEDFEAHHARGVRTFKFKCGRDAEREKAALLRALCADGVALRLDPNGAFRMPAVERFLGSLPLERIEWIEDPMPELSDWSALRDNTGLPLALDEPLARGLSFEQASVLAPDVIVLKPMALGGFAACIGWAKWARVRQTSVCVSHLFDGNAAMSATIQLAFAVQSPMFAAGLGEHVALSSDPSGAPPAPFLSGGTLTCPRTAGVGS